MAGEITFKGVKKLLEEHNQGHLLAFWFELDDAQKEALLTQIEALDLEKIDSLVADYVLKKEPPAVPSELLPVTAYTPQPRNPAEKRKHEQAKRIGKKLISEGKVAAFVVAGGQGTRLGFDGPKGDLPISPVKNKTLFQIFAETIAAVSRQYNATCPWYVMTSPINHHETLKIFRSNNYYGLNRDSVFIFQQDTLPNFGFDGRILLSDEASIACSPDGHGGSLRALSDSGATADMRNRGVEYISYWQIDNPLVKVFDPLFVGLHAIDNAEMSSKALTKTGPYEKVGNFCLVDGKVMVIEYSDLSDEQAERRNPDGSLVFRLGSIGIHIISRRFVERFNSGGLRLPLHKAIKRIPHIDSSGNPVVPTNPNGIKLEAFVFDALPLATRTVTLETIRSEEFAPTKNATGVDSVETTRQMMVMRAADWLQAAGVPVPRKSDDSPDCLIEIAPDFALEKDDIKAKRSRIPKIKPGDCIYLE